MVTVPKFFFGGKMSVSTIDFKGFGLTGTDILSVQKNGMDLEKTYNFQKALEDASNNKNIKNDTVNNISTKISSKYDTRLPGDYISSFKNDKTTKNEKKATPVGFAANSASKDVEHSKKVTIDKTDKLYEKALELESYIVKIMLNSMKSTLNGSGLSGDDSYATKMYQDMFYDELAGTVTKNAGFGLADQVYLQLKA